MEICKLTVVMAVQRCNRAMSPRRTNKKTTEVRTVVL